MTDLLTTASVDTQLLVVEPARPRIRPIITAFPCPEGGECVSECGPRECAKVAFTCAD
jgi:hypothetical protein